MNWDENHPAYKAELGRRILSIVDRFETKSAAAQSAGVSVEQLNKWMGIKDSDIPKVPVSALLGLAEAAKVDFYWLATGNPAGAEVAVHSEWTEIPRYNASLSAGTGCFLDSAEVINTIPFRPEFFTKNLQRNASDMIIVDAQGDSMQPTMHDRDLVMIDKSTATETLFAGVYAFSYEGALYVKRLQKMPGGILATSDNKEYEKFMIGAEAMDHFNLIGRVVWVGRMM